MAIFMSSSGDTGNSSLRELYARLLEDAPDDLSRVHLRRRVLEALSAAPTAKRLGVPGLAFGAAAAALLLAVAVVLLSQYRGEESSEPTLTIHANGGVHLQWTDAGKARYRVLKTTNPADFSKARVETVQGTSYQDREPGEGSVTYYRVE